MTPAPNGCPDCARVTSGDCGRHGPVWASLPLTRTPGWGSVTVERVLNGYIVTHQASTTVYTKINDVLEAVKVVLG